MRVDKTPLYAMLIQYSAINMCLGVDGVKKKVINKCARVGVMMFILVLGTMGAMALDSSTFPADQPTAVWEEESPCPHLVLQPHEGAHRVAGFPGDGHRAHVLTQHTMQHVHEATQPTTAVP